MVIKIKKINIPKKELEKMYVNKILSTYKIAKEYACDPTVIQNRLKEYDIPRRIPKKRISISKKELVNLYLKKKLSTYKIAKLYNCRNSTIGRKLEESKIKTRRLEKIEILKGELIYLYSKRRLPLSKIAKKFNCSIATIFKNMKLHNIKLRTTSEACTKYLKKDFSGDLEEKAYLIGFRIGDLHAKRIGSIIILKTNTTKTEQVELIRSLFKKYGHFYTKKHNSVFYTQCQMNNSFSFLLPKENYIYNWILGNEKYFFSFLAGYTDAEGNIGIYSNMAKFRLRSYDKKILYQIHNKLNILGIKTNFGLESRSGIRNQNQDCWGVYTGNKSYLLRLFDSLEPYLKHKKRRNDMDLARLNVIERNLKYGA
ncbi:MAG: hypothetical protein KJ906_03090 [Nanoarchaeota archaeon]|nr:hypothetical protein [Nanoarchaeota archaeon]